ncbi:MAG: OB-fold domain-containing protein [Thermodesulfobacteriota bacterium]|nr:OB-fold domain-containing protein [Thermodesulfobacteriota bacterium]
MIGIVSYGGFLPVNRIKRETIFKAMGWLHQATFMKGEKCVANFDEDSITMAVASGMNCLEGRDREGIEQLYFATTTSPFSERCGAGIIGTALDISSKISTFDLTGSIRAGTSALISALNSISSGAAHSALVCASDMRLGKPGSSQELGFSDGAASLLIGDKDVIAEWEGSYSVSYDFPGAWRTENDKTDRAWEDRFGREEGYKKFIVESISGLMDKYKQNPGDINKIIFPGIYPRDHASICRTLGFGPEQTHDHLMNDMGNTGTAYPLMLLISALEEAIPGQRLIVAGYGNGCDALLFQVTDNIESIQRKKRAIKKSLQSKKELKSYEKYLAFRGLISPEGGIRAEAIPYTAMSLTWRDRREILGLCGTRCKECGTPQYPAQKVCVNPGCQAVDKMEPYRFSDKKGKIFSFTADLLSYTPNPPAIYAVIDFEGGGRFWFDLTDCDIDSLKIGTEVEMTFRRRYVDQRGGIIGYFWKAVPVWGYNE